MRVKSEKQFAYIRILREVICHVRAVEYVRDDGRPHRFTYQKELHLIHNLPFIVSHPDVTDEDMPWLTMGISDYLHLCDRENDMLPGLCFHLLKMYEILPEEVQSECCANIDTLRKLSEEFELEDR